MRVIRDPGWVLLDDSEWAVVLPLLKALGYRWEVGGQESRSGEWNKLWEPTGKRCVGEWREQAVGGGVVLCRYVVDASYLVDVLPGLLWPERKGT